ncbi:hypothetical protein C2S51_034565 [Perilla frutescens var. frutescens]|nr:hypothetical protein C2S51_034565 [Perilla frutescens var. frutescens]
MGLEDSKQVTWADMKKDEDDRDSMESSSSINDSEPSSSSSSLSADLADDAASSSTTSSNSSPSRGALYEFAELMAQLPIKKGLSKYYNGKSQTFASMESVRSVEDLAKEERFCSKRMKSCKSYGSNLNNRHKFGPKPTIAKRSSSPKGTFTFSPMAAQLH